MAITNLLRTESFNDWRLKLNELSGSIGDPAGLTTAAMTYTGAINELKDLDVEFSGVKTFTDDVIVTADVEVDGDITMHVGELTLKDSIAGNTTLSMDAMTGDISSSGALTVDGLVTLNDNLNVAGNLTVDGTVTTINSEVVVVEDPVMTLGGSTVLTSDDNKDRGIEFNYYDGGHKTGFIGFNNATGEFKLIPDATNTGEVFTGPIGTLDANVEWNNILDKPDPTVTLNLLGDITGSAATTLTDLASGTINLTTAVTANSVDLGTHTVGNYIKRLTQSTGVTIVNPVGEGAEPTISIGQDVAPTAAVTFDDLTVNSANPIDAKIDRTNVNGIDNYLDRNSGSTQVVNADTEYAAGTVMTVLGTLDITDGNLVVGAGSGTLAVNTTYIELGDNGTIDPQDPDSGGIILNRGTGNPDVRLFWDETVKIWKLKELNDAGTTAINSRVLTTHSIKDILTGNTESGINVTYDENNDKANFNVDDFTITLSGDIGGSVTINDLGSATLSTTIQPNSVALGTDTTGNYVGNVTANASSGLTVSSGTGEGVTKTITVDSSVVRTTGAQTIAGDKMFDDNVTIGGDLTVTGDLITINSEVVQIADNILLLNSNVTGNPSENAGIEIERGTASNVSVLWNETTDKWTLTEDGSTFHNILTTSDTDEVLKFIDGDGTTISVSPNQSLKFSEGAGLNINFTDVTGPAFVLDIENTDRGSVQNIFKNVAVSGQGTIVADNNNDTLTFAGAGGIDVTTSTGSDTVTITHANTSSVTNLSSLNSNGNVIQDITFNFDTYGHVTGRNVVVTNLDSRYYTEAESDSRFANVTGDTFTGDVVVAKNRPWLTLDSPGTGDAGNEQAAGISLGESGNGSASLHLTYTGDGKGHIGMGTVTDAIPEFEVMELQYQTNVATFKATPTVLGNTVWHAGNDGAGSGLDADLLDGQSSAYYRNANNINAGTISDARLPATISSDITGSAASLTTARTISLSGDATGSVSFNGTSNVTIPVVIANNSHTHTSGNITDFTEAVQDVAGGMVSANTESGISVTYNDSAGKLNFDVDDFTITAGGVVTGSAVVSNLSNTAITLGFASGAVIDKAKQLETARTISLSGDATGSVSFNGTSNVTIPVVIANDSHSHTDYISSNSNDDVTGHTEWQDTYQARFGNSADMKIYHEGGVNYIDVLQDLYIRHNGENMASFHDDANCQFYHNGSKKFETNTAGTRTYGDMLTDGDITMGGNLTGVVNLYVAGTIFETSDISVKEDIEVIDDALDRVKQINGVTFTRSDLVSEDRQTGVIAQEVEEVLPEAVNTDEDGFKTVAYGNMVGLLIEAIKEQSETIDSLKSRIETLEGNS